MKKFVVYDKADGRILRSGFCPDALLSAQGGPDHEVMEFERTNETHVLDGKLVRIEPPPRPAPTPEEVVAREEATYRQDVIDNMPDILLMIENRLNALEGKPPATAEQLKAKIRGKG